GFEETERRRERVGPPGAAPAPDGREASEPEHERACLAAAPDDAGPWQVYADWLQGRGDPRGTLAALFLSGQGAAGTSFLERWREALLGPAAQLVPLEAGALVFRHGFLTQARLWRRRGSATDLSALTRAFLAQPFTRFVTALRFGLASDEADNDWGPTLAALVESPRAAQLSALAFDDFGPDEADLASTPFGDLSRLWAGLPALEHLSLRSGAGGVLGRVEHPRLKSFVRVSTGLSASELRSIGAARWPALERLELWTGSTALGAEVTAEALRPLVEGQALPRLTHLGLVACEEARELVPMLLGSPLLPRLRTLDLSRGLVADAEAGLLLRHADRLRHLERLDLSENLLSPAGRDALARALPNARLDGQRTDEGRIVASLDES
ncbi:MAG: TIGR02996 domain-containing protein, partial [Myxococcaceae bacterium]|nr:TIGR02996 domain-containing protein [Myxococcaceae bacterium]